MEKTKQQLFRNPDIYPSEDAIAEALKEAIQAFHLFTSKLEKHQIELEWRYYTDGKSWLGKGLYEWVGTRGGQKIMTVFWLSIWDGFFKVTIYLPENVRAAAMELPVDVETKEKISQTKTMGKLRFFPIVFDIQKGATFDELFSIIDFKKTLK